VVSFVFLCNGEAKNPFNRKETVLDFSRSQRNERREGVPGN
jgi:hypothetical protein